MGILTIIKSWFSKETEEGQGHKNGNGNGNGNGKDLKITCAECRKPFIFEAGEQKFYKMRGLTPPKRCTNCRNKRRRRR